MKVKDIIKKQTTIVAIAVIAIVITAIGVSYAIFFDVKTSSTQVITAGTLEITLGNTNALELDEPMSNEAGLASSAFSYTISNTGNLPASYNVYIYADTTNAVDLSTVNIALNGSTTVQTLSSLTSSSCTVDSKTYTCYSIGSGSIVAGATDSSTKYVRVWINEDATGDLTNSVLSLNLHVTTAVNE